MGGADHEVGRSTPLAYGLFSSLTTIRWTEAEENRRVHKGCPAYREAALVCWANKNPRAKLIRNRP